MTAAPMPELPGGIHHDLLKLTVPFDIDIDIDLTEINEI